MHLSNISPISITIPSDLSLGANVKVTCLKSNNETLTQRNKTFSSQEDYSSYMWLGDDYCYSVEFISNDLIYIDKLINKKIQISISYRELSNKIYGIIDNVTLSNRKSAMGEANYKISVVSSINILKQKKTDRIFVKKTAKEILKTLLKENLYQERIDYIINLEKSYPIIECWIQYQESDYDNLQRLISKWGIFYYYSNGIVYFVDGNQRCNNTNIIVKLSNKLDQVDASFVSFNPKWTYLEEGMRYSEYNPKAPLKPFNQSASNTTDVQAYGTKHISGANYYSLDMGRYLIDIKQKSVDWQRELFYLDTLQVNINLGDRVFINDGLYKKFTGYYLVVAKKERLNVGSACFAVSVNSTDKGYINELVLIPILRQYKLPSCYHQKQYPALEAKIAGTNKTDIVLDKEGCYRLDLNFKRYNKLDKNMSSPIRALSSNSGANYDKGFNIPYPTESEVIISFINGDINRPVIQGESHKTTNPVTARNSQQNIISTKSTTITFDDDNKLPSLSIKNINNLIRFSSNLEEASKSKIEVLAKKGIHEQKFGDEYNQKILDDSNINIKNNYYKDIKLSYTIASKSANVICNKDNNTSIDGCFNIKTDNNTKLESSNNILIKNKSLIVQSKSSLDIESKASSISISSSRDLSICANRKIIIQQSGAFIKIENRGVFIYSPVSFSASSSIKASGLVNIN